MYSAQDAVFSAVCSVQRAVCIVHREESSLGCDKRLSIRGSSLTHHTFCFFYLKNKEKICHMIIFCLSLENRDLKHFC